MVLSRERDAERPPLSVILPRLYLGAESDVTQERLASLGISYVLSVSRCSPQPSFLPQSRFLRIPIDDSLWDDLLPWIPPALRFIDAAMSSGASVLVHCAAGISRSPALAVAYIMYSLEMDLDHAYRFVKERRPSISPNFNFLGQLQHFQGALSRRAPGGHVLIQQLDVDDSQNRSADGAADSAHHHHSTQQRLSEGNPQHELRTFGPTQNQQTPREVPAGLGPSEPVEPALKPTKLQLPSSSASLLEKRKSLTLSLTPLTPAGSSQLAGTVPGGADTHSHTGSCRRAGDAHRELGPASHNRGEVKEQGLLSPFSFTLNKLLDWGERLLLGGAFVHPVRMGQPALPYRC